MGLTDERIIAVAKDNLRLKQARFHTSARCSVTRHRRYSSSTRRGRACMRASTRCWTHTGGRVARGARVSHAQDI